MTVESEVRRRAEVTPYLETNETINRLLSDDEMVWIVQGRYGRAPILANTAEEAMDSYIDKYRSRMGQDEELNDSESSEVE